MLNVNHVVHELKLGYIITHTYFNIITIKYIYIYIFEVLKLHNTPYCMYLCTCICITRVEITMLYYIIHSCLHILFPSHVIH